jgi:CRP/FNR family cyclic AMP-dependent transcriptional regulator
VYVLLEGSVKVELLTPGGTEVILAVLGPGEVVGEMSLADSLGRSAGVKTLEETTLLCMDRVTFLSSVEEAPVLARNLANLLSRRLRLANAHVRSLAAQDVPGRVAARTSPYGGERDPMEAARLLRTTERNAATCAPLDHALRTSKTRR